MVLSRKKILLLSSLLFSLASTRAQYYYKDIWVTTQLNKEFILLKEEKIRSVNVKSFEDDGSPSEGFFLQRKIDKNFRISETVSNTSFTDQSLLTATMNDEGRIISSVDSSTHSVGLTRYNYTNKGKVISLFTQIHPPGDSAYITEERIYTYGPKGNVEKMIRKKNGLQVSEVNFTLDEAGNVAEEIESPGKKYYYYYDSKNRLTDVVRYNALAKRLLPDYMFSYNAAGNMTQQVAVSEGSSNYFIWKYTYNDLGLKETEKVFSKERRLLGTIEYAYKK